MKRRGILVSAAIIFILAAVLFTGLLYLEHKDDKEPGFIEAEQTSIQETVSDSSTVTGEILIETEASGQNGTDAADSSLVSLVFAGDVYLSGHVTNLYDASGIAGVLDEKLLAEMQNADILMVNEEFPFGTKGAPVEDKEYTFRVNPLYVSILKDMGVDIVSLANNHVLDYGTETLQETFQVLEENDIIYAGAGNDSREAGALRTIEAGGETYGFLAASRVIPVAEWNAGENSPGVFTTYDETALVAAIAQAKQVCDYLTVYVHWGIERNTAPEEYQTGLAHAYIDAGADLVIGAHPHVLQGIEEYQGKLIFYSLGNFIFNQSIDKTMLVKMVKQGEETSFYLLPAHTSGARTQTLEDTDSFYTYMESLSTGITIENGEIKIHRE